MADEKILNESIDIEEVNDEYQYITVLDDDGSEIQCEILGLFDYKEQTYIALAPTESNLDYIEVYIFGYRAVDDMSFDLIEIETDEEYDEIAEEFYRQMEEYKE